MAWGSLELGVGVDVTLEGAVVNVGTVVVQVGHDWLVLGTVPLNVARLAHPVPVHILVVLVIDGSLSGAPFAMGIRHGWVLRENAGDSPVEQVWVIDESLGVEGVIVQHNGAVVTETTTDTTDDEIADPSVGQPAANIEVLDGQFTDHGESEEDAELGARGVVGPVEVRLVGGARDHGQVLLGEPAGQHVHVMESLGSPLVAFLLKDVL